LSYAPILIYKYSDKFGICLILSSFKYGWFLYQIIASRLEGNIGCLLLGLLRLYAFKFKVKGFGFKFIKFKKGLSIKLGYTHRILILVSSNQKLIFKNKYFFISYTRNIVKIKQLYNFLFFYVTQNPYKKLGIFLKGSIYKVKLSKKKSKF